MRISTLILLALVATGCAGTPTGGSADLPDGLAGDLASPDGQTDPVVDAVAEGGLPDATDPACAGPRSAGDDLNHECVGNVGCTVRHFEAGPDTCCIPRCSACRDGVCWHYVMWDCKECWVDVPDAETSDALNTDDGADAAQDDGPDASPGTPPFRPTGWIRAIEDMTASASHRSRIDVAMMDGPLPTSQAVVATEGPCTLLVGALPGLCTPSCTTGSTCIDGVCTPFPAPAPAGRIVLSGLAEPLSLAPSDQGAYPVPALPTDLFAPGAAVRAVAEGGATPAFDLAAAGVEDLESTVEDVPFVPGEDYPVTWTPPSTTVPGARIRLEIETGWHGSPGLFTLWCETEDNGSLTVPASLTAQVPVPMCGKCERSTLARFTRDIVDFGAGPIVLEVASEQSFIPWW